MRHVMERPTRSRWSSLSDTYVPEEHRIREGLPGRGKGPDVSHLLKYNVLRCRRLLSSLSWGDGIGLCGGDGVFPEPCGTG